MMKEKNNEIRQLRVRMPDNIWAQVEVYSRATNRSVNNVISTAVEEYLVKNTNNETVFLETMNKLTKCLQQLIVQEKNTTELVEAVHNRLDSMGSNLNKVEYENRTHLILFLDFLRHSYSLFRKEVDSKNRTSNDIEASIRFMNDYLQEFVAFRQKYGSSFIKLTLDSNANSINK